MDETSQNGATVTLNADTGPWERGLERARSAVDGWSAKVTDRFAGMAESIKGKTEAISAAVSSIREKAADTGNVGSAVGDVLGSAIGTAFGPGVGTAIGGFLGREIGSGLAEAIDFDSIVSRFEELTPLIKDQAEAGNEAWAGVKYTAEKAFADIKQTILGVDVAELMSGSADEVEAKFTALGDTIGAKVETAFGQILTRMADFIDATVERFKGPVAAVADWLQKMAVQLGIVDEGTDKWGDSIRDLKDIGVDAMAAVARGIGYVTDVLRIAGGAVMTAYVSPFLEGLSKLMAGLREAAEAVRDMVPQGAGGGAGGEFDKLAGAADKFSERLGTMGKAIKARGEELVGTGLQMRQADIIEKWFRDNIPGFREKNNNQDKERKAPPPGAAPPAVEAAAQVAAGSARRVEAQIQGSREAIRSIIADADRGGGAAANAPVQKAAAAAAANVEAVKAGNVIAQQLLTVMKDVRAKLPGVDDVL